MSLVSSSDYSSFHDDTIAGCVFREETRAKHLFSGGVFQVAGLVLLFTQSRMLCTGRARYDGISRHALPLRCSVRSSLDTERLCPRVVCTAIQTGSQTPDTVNLIGIDRCRVLEVRFLFVRGDRSQERFEQVTKELPQISGTACEIRIKGLKFGVQRAKGAADEPTVGEVFSLHRHCFGWGLLENALTATGMSDVHLSYNSMHQVCEDVQLSLFVQVTLRVRFESLCSARPKSRNLEEAGYAGWKERGEGGERNKK